MSTTCAGLCFLVPCVVSAQPVFVGRINFLDFKLHSLDLIFWASVNNSCSSYTYSLWFCRCHQSPTSLSLLPELTLFVSFPPPAVLLTHQVLICLATHWLLQPCTVPCSPTDTVPPHPTVLLSRYHFGCVLAIHL